MRDQRNATIVCQPSRNRLPILLFAAAGTSLALLLAGCGSGAPVVGVSVESTSSTVSVPMTPADAVRWLDGYCGAVNGFLADHNNAITQTPDFMSAEEGRQELSKMLGDYAAILTKAIDRLADLPPITDPAGRAAKETYVGNYTSARDMVTSAKTQLDATSPDDIDAQMHAAEASTAAQKTALSVIFPEAKIMDSPELSAALPSAEQCTSAS